MLSLTALMGFLLFSGLPVGGQVSPIPTVPNYSVTLTAYNAVPEQTDGNPFETASGAYSNPEVIAARSQDLADELPFGTIIELEGTNITSENTCGYNVVAPRIGYRVIEDTMNAKFTNRIDVLLDTKKDYATADAGMQNAAQVLGICKGVTIRVVGYVDVNHIPKTQAALAKLVVGEDGLALK
jgi:3D (Asp-Asp-Asp) domain-containing protein